MYNKKLLAALQVLLVESHGNLQKSVLHRAHSVRIQIEESSISPFSRKSWEETKETEGQREREMKPAASLWVAQKDI